MSPAAGITARTFAPRKRCLAAADGLYTIGFNRLGGYRLWLCDTQGNEFYYAALGNFAVAVEGRSVKAGDVTGPSATRATPTEARRISTSRSIPPRWRGSA